MGKVNFEKDENEKISRRDRPSKKGRILPSDSAIKIRKKLNKRRRQLKKKLSIKKSAKLLTTSRDNSGVKKLPSKDKLVNLNESCKPMLDKSDKPIIIEKGNLTKETEKFNTNKIKSDVKQKKKQKKRNSKKKDGANNNLIPSLDTQLFSGTLSPNWEALKKTLDKEKSNAQKSWKRQPKRKHEEESKSNETKEPVSQKEIWFDVDPILIKSDPAIPKIGKSIIDVVALDCEMVGGGVEGEDNILARVSIVDQHLKVLYDQYVKPTEKIVDYRTEFSGIRPHNLVNGAEFETVQKEVDDILRDKILVGHSLKHDLHCLLTSHPRNCIRDTATYKPFQKFVRKGTPSLKMLAEIILSTNIQEGEHNSVEDASAAMQIYLLHRNDWETTFKKKITGLEKVLRKKAHKNRETADEVVPDI